MSAALEAMRDHLAAELQLALSEAGHPVGTHVVFAVVDRALAGAGYADLAAACAAADSAAFGFKEAYSGPPPIDLEVRDDAWTGARLLLTTHPVNSALLYQEP